MIELMIIITNSRNQNLMNVRIEYDRKTEKNEPFTNQDTVKVIIKIAVNID